MNTAYVYILTNENNSVLYVGMTTDLRTRLWEHKTKLNSNSFTAKYNVYKLVYFESLPTICDAISREKYLKGKSRKYKSCLINTINPSWDELPCHGE